MVGAGPTPAEETQVRHGWHGFTPLPFIVGGLLAGCGGPSVPSGFPPRPDDTGGPAPSGNVGFQPPFLPIVFTITTDGKISVAVSRPKLVTSLGTVSITGGPVLDSGSGQPIPPKPADTTRVVNRARRSRPSIKAHPAPHVYGPARIDVEVWDFNATSPDTDLDFEKSRSGQTPDLEYDHLTGDLKFINGAQVSRVDTYWWSPRTPSNNIPSELECQQAGDWAPQPTADQLASTYVLACVKSDRGLGGPENGAAPAPG